MKIGYVRVSTDDQTTDQQRDELKAAGCERFYEDVISGKSKERPELDKMLEALRPGDQVSVVRLDRLGRNLKHLLTLVEHFEKGGVDFVSLSESIDTSSPTGRLTFSLFGALAQYERDLISERTKSALKAARARGRKGGRKPSLSKKQIGQARKMLLNRDNSVKEVAEIFGVKRTTLYSLGAVPPLQT